MSTVENIPRGGKEELLGRKRGRKTENLLKQGLFYGMCLTRV
jgi:hypothetical protein